MFIVRLSSYKFCLRHFPYNSHDKCVQFKNYTDFISTLGAVFYLKFKLHCIQHSTIGMFC